MVGVGKVVGSTRYPLGGNTWSEEGLAVELSCPFIAPQRPLLPKPWKPLSSALIDRAASCALSLELPSSSLTSSSTMDELVFSKAVRSSVSMASGCPRASEPAYAHPVSLSSNLNRKGLMLISF